MCIFIVTHPFKQGISDTVRDASLDLAICDYRIDDPSAVVDDDIAVNGDGTRCRVKLNLCDMAPVRIDKA